MAKRHFAQPTNTGPAGLAPRLGAMLYDGLLLAAIWIAVTVAHLAFYRFVVGQPAEDIGTSVVDIWSLRLLLVLFTTLFFVFCWRRGGMTLGMQAWRLRVQTLEGETISVKQGLLRCLTAWLSLAALGIGYWWVLVDGQWRSWPDIASKTQTVRLPKN
ncbi:MAG: RDD family protein [Pseudomonadota bacterium]